jgi:ribosomal protein L28
MREHHCFREKRFDNVSKRAGFKSSKRESAPEMASKKLMSMPRNTVVRMNITARGPFRGNPRVAS